ncbi:purine nucleoside permease [Mesorhizobium sp. 1M-11]|uniref:purine-nucleoside phosphorylase n=1 Tax=Mesorhizobium sp. 1M-11 TaxID=1529006 RepID=UPI0006C765A2|nr:purine nucleoside permease [Mesorhizobium sp. 1M-11]
MPISYRFGLASAALAAALVTTATMAQAEQPIAPKVLVVTMFGGEAKPWLEGRKFDTKLKVPGLSKEYPEVACDATGLCVMTTAMGYANAASSVSAVIYSGLFDLRQSYILIAGIAGVDPSDGTLGSAHWARFAVDAGLRHEIDPRQIPADWPDGVVALGAQKPGEKPKWGSGTEVYKLNEKLAEKALALTSSVELADSDKAKAYRAAYKSSPGNAAPAVSICDTLSTDTYWHGTKTAESMGKWVSLLTDGAGNYCTTQMEDNASLTALQRGADAGLLQFDRIALLRTASNFDREPDGKTAIESLSADSGGFGPATANAYRVGSKFADTVINEWAEWQKTVAAK